MAKKGLITSLILGAVLTLSLGVYSLVVALVALTTPVHTTVAYAYTSDQKITAFSGYSINDGNLEIQYSAGQEDLLIANIEDNSYSVDVEREFFTKAKAGSSFNIKAVATTNKYGSTTTYDITIYKQGSGKATDESPYCIANTEGLLALVNQMEDEGRYQDTHNVIGSLLTDSEAKNGLVSIVADLDLNGIDWKGLSKDYTHPFNDIIEGNGHSIKNMNIHVTSQNYDEFVGTMINSTDSEQYQALCVGFIRNAQNAKISGLSIVDSQITIDSDVLSKIDVEGAKYNYLRAGLLVGDARNTQIDGKYTKQTTTYTTQINDDPSKGEVGAEVQVPVTTTTEHSSVVSGKVNGFSYSSQNGLIVNGLGGLVGTLINATSSSEKSSISNYEINVSIENTTIASDKVSKNSYIGGVAGQVRGTLTNKIAVENVKATFNSNALFNNRNFIGGVVGAITHANVKDIDVNATIRDTVTKPTQWVVWMGESGEDYAQYTESAGIAARANETTFEDITSNAYIDVLATSSAGFVGAKSVTMQNVLTKGTVLGETATGLVKWLNDSTVRYTAEADTSINATDVTLSGWNTAGLVGYANSSNIIGQGSVNAIVTINAKGGVQEDSKNIQNTMMSAGLIGYMYSTDLNNEYVLDGIDATVIINNTINGAGLVAYLGNDTLTLDSKPAGKVSVQNCSVNLTVKSNLEAGNRSTTHQVGGAVITIYGVAKLENVDVIISFNANAQPDKKYGVAWFGGLVARIGGKFVTINNCKASGDAYINSTIYTKAFETSPKYEQLVAGGLVGGIASFNKTIGAGEHPTYGENDLGLATTTTFDDVCGIDTSTIVITNNTASVNINIAFAKESTEIGPCMKEEGYRARSAGTFIGLVMNGIDSDNDGLYDILTKLDLSTNTVSGILSADSYTFSFITKTEKAQLSSMGWGKITDQYETPKCVGSSYDLVSNEQYSTDITFPTIVSEGNGD